MSAHNRLAPTNGSEDQVDGFAEYAFDRALDQDGSSESGSGAAAVADLRSSAT
jgi:hypothetical protein